MMSNATRALCAMLSLIGAAGLVMFADPAVTGTAKRPLAAPATIATAVAAPIAIVHRG